MCNLSLKKENPLLKGMLNELHGTTLEYSQSQQLTACLIEMYSGFQETYTLNKKDGDPFGANVRNWQVEVRNLH
jgi:hypothetical protein